MQSPYRVLHSLSTVALATAVLACTANDEQRPYGPGGPGGGGVATSDAGPGSTDGTASSLVTARFCLIADMRTPRECAPGDSIPGGVDVQILDTGETLNAGATFTFDAKGARDIRLLVAAATPSYRTILVPTPVPADSTVELLVPLMSQTMWDSVVTKADAIEPQDTASIVAVITRNGLPVAGAQAISPSGSITSPLYSIESEKIWESDGVTETNGTTLILGVLVDGATTNFGVTANSVLTNVDVPVLPDVLTFTEVAL